MSETLEFETRKKIYNTILKNPGVHVSRIAELLDVSPQLVDYHLIYMQRYDLIAVDKEKGYKRCYVKGQINSEDKKKLSILRQDIPLNIVLFLLKNPFSRHRDIFRYLGISSARLSYHLKKMFKIGIIEISSSNGKTGYVVCNKKEIIELLTRYQPSGIAKMVKNTWEDFGPI